MNKYDRKKMSKLVAGEIYEWAMQNNTIPLKDNPNIHLCLMDGGWVNVLNLREFLVKKGWL